MLGIVWNPLFILSLFSCSNPIVSSGRDESTNCDCDQEKIRVHAGFFCILDHEESERKRRAAGHFVQEHELMEMLGE